MPPTRSVQRQRMIDKISNALSRSKIFQHRDSKFTYLLTVLFTKAYRLYVHRAKSRRARLKPDLTKFRSITPRL